MADYLSRRPSPNDGNVVKAEEMLNIIVIDGITPTLIKAKQTNVAKQLNTQVLTVHAPVHKLNQSKQVEKLQESEKLEEQLNLANSKRSNVYVQAKYESEKTIQKIIRLVKDLNVAVIPMERNVQFI